MRRYRSELGVRHAYKQARTLTAAMSRHNVTAGELAEASGEPLEMIEGAMKCARGSYAAVFISWMLATEVWLKQERVSEFLTGARFWAAEQKQCPAASVNGSRAGFSSNEKF